MNSSLQDDGIPYHLILPKEICNMWQYSTLCIHTLGSQLERLLLKHTQQLYIQVSCLQKKTLHKQLSISTAARVVSQGTTKHGLIDEILHKVRWMKFKALKCCRI